VAGVVVLTLFLLGVWVALRPRRVRRLRFDLRYPLAGAAVALTATALHEMVGFGLQSPINRYLLAAWIGLVWGVWGRVEKGRRRGQPEVAEKLVDVADSGAQAEDSIGDRDGNGNENGGEG
jgi:hypothetical protein